MIKTELMKRYMEETGDRAESFDDIYMPVYQRGFLNWIMEQLTWHPVSEKPESMGMYLAEVRPYMGNVDVIVTTVYFNGESFLGYDDVVRWLTIPPAPEGE